MEVCNKITSGGGERELFTSNAEWPAGPVATDLQDGRQGTAAAGGGGRGVEALPSYLPGRATATPVIHSRAGASAVCAP